jgi:hypothetical protein
MAEDTAAKLSAGAAANAVVPSEQVELNGSLQPYIMVFDAQSRLVASSAQLNGQAPPFPPSVFDSARTRGQDRISWQPAPGVRSAVVVQPWRDGFVVVGRSLRLAEERIDQIRLLTGFVWLVTLGCTAIAALVAAGASRLR